MKRSPSAAKRSAQPGDAARLLEGEHPDVRQEAERVAGTEWLDLPNAHFSGRTPAEMIERGQEDAVRRLLRTIKHVGFS